MQIMKQIHKSMEAWKGIIMEIHDAPSLKSCGWQQTNMQNVKIHKYFSE